MARPQKQGLDYFPLDVDFLQDIKIRKLIKSQNAGAIAVYTLLLSLIYKNGYYVSYDEDLLFIISEQTHYEEEYIREVIHTCLSVGLFSKELFSSDKVLTSRSIQERFQLIAKMSKRKTHIGEFCLVSSEETPVNSEETPVSSEKMPQRKVKESKVKENKSSSDDDEKKSAASPQSSITNNLDKEIDFMKSEECWLQQLQVLHKLDAHEIASHFTTFRAQCLADGKQGHPTLQDAKTHFNNWLRIQKKHETNKSNNYATIKNNRHQRFEIVDAETKIFGGAF